MIEAAILRTRSVELLAGEIVEMAPETLIHYSLEYNGVLTPKAVNLQVMLHIRSKIEIFKEILHRY